jgi:hypothetical protein
MTGRVNHRDTVTISPYGEAQPQVDDVVLVKVKGREYLHLVKAKQGERYLIGNNRGGLNGWVGRHAIFGHAVRVESPQGHASRVQQDGK